MTADNKKLCSYKLSPLPPLGNKTNPGDQKSRFVFFFNNEYFGIKLNVPNVRI